MRIFISCFMNVQKGHTFEESVLLEYHAVSLAAQFPTLRRNTVVQVCSLTSRPLKTKALLPVKYPQLNIQ
jgi:hypothetical protein